MESDPLTDAPLQDYPDRSVWTTWAISYQAIRLTDEATANLLLLWSYLDNKDLWHGLFAAACRRSSVAARMLSGWIGDIASSEIRFSGAMLLLRNYSLVEEVAETTSYATHPVVHQWAQHSQGKYFAIELSRLSVVIVGWAVPDSSTRDYTALQRRLLPHAQACSRRKAKKSVYFGHESDEGEIEDVDKDEEQETTLAAILLLGNLYKDQGKLDKAEQMYERALRGREEALGASHTSTLDTVNNLGLLYADQGKLDKAEQMYERALRGKEKALGASHTLTLATINNLGILYANQGKLDKAEQMFERALRGYEEALGHEQVQQYIPALNTLENLGNHYARQGNPEKARTMYAQALSGLCSVLGQSSDRCIHLAAEIDALPIPRKRRSRPQAPSERLKTQHE
jgi:Tfp pilus assembly protein PilF